MVFDLECLPAEVRQMIWEATLPGCRVFHVTSFNYQDHSDALFNKTTNEHEDFHQQAFDFHIRHDPPTATQVCRESRHVALLRGFFISSSEASASPTRPGLWFNPHRDMLYFDRNMRRYINTKHPLNITGIQRVLHVGVEWRAWFRDVPSLQPGDDISLHWQRAMKLLLRHCPRIKTFNFILPQVRYNGTMPSGREPYSAKYYPCDLVSLPSEVKVPWERQTRLPFDSTSFQSIEWSAIFQQMEAALNLLQSSDTDTAADEKIQSVATRKGNRSSIKGWWLIRPGAPTDYRREQVREFLS